MVGSQRKGETMKRTPELRTLSEDHHYGLVHARRLRRAAEGDEGYTPEAAAKAFLDFWQNDISVHLCSHEP
jgi:hypothetical protein